MAGVCARVGFWGGRTDFSGVKRFGTTDLSGQKRTKRVRRRARRRLFSLGLTWEDGLAGVCARVGFCGVENSGAGKIVPAKQLCFVSG